MVGKKRMRVEHSQCFLSPANSISVYLVGFTGGGGLAKGGVVTAKVSLS